MKKILSVVLSLIMVTSVMFVMPDSVSAKTDHSQAEAVAWANSLVGTTVGNGQCVSLITAYYSYLGVSPVSGNGCDYATNALPSGWSRIKYYSGFVAQPGDIAVFDYSKWAIIDGVQYGHVGIVKSGTASSFDFYDQNPTPVRLSTGCGYNRSDLHFWGVVRPDFASEPTGNNPQGCVDVVEGGNGTVHVRGWAFDRDDISETVTIDVYIGGGAGNSSAEKHRISANTNRPDVNNEYGCGDYHGFDVVLPTAKTGNQAVYLYALNIGAGSDNPEIGHKDTTIIPDTTSPVVYNVTNSDYTYDSAGYTLHFTVSDNVALNYVRVYYWRDGSPQCSKDISLSGTKKTIDFRVNYSDFENERSGYMMAIWCFDIAGNRGDSPFLYVPTGENPVVSNITNSNYTFDSNGFTLRFTVSDDIGLDFVRVYYWRNDTPQYSKDISLSGKNQTVDFRVNYSDFGNAKDGYIMAIWCFDITGNRGDSPFLYVPCGGDKIDDEKISSTTETKPAVNKTTITLAKYSANIYVKGTTTIKPTVKNGKGVTTYKSNNTKVAKVDSRGKVTALKAGTAKITVTNNKVSKVFTVKVLNPKLNKTSVSISRGKSYTLKITGKIGTAKFYTSNKKIATVNSKGKITVNKKAKRGSTAIITVRTNGITLKCKVKVK